MPIIDPSLKFMLQEASEGLERLDALEGVSAGALEAGAPEPTVRVLVQFDGDVAELEAQGFEPRTIAGDVASGLLPLSSVDAVASLPQVVRIELTRPMQSELDRSLPDIRADLVHGLGWRGSGVIVGIIDSGIDLMHQCFRRQDGTTRILSIWDQVLMPAGPESAPMGYAYGVEYSETDINACITAGGPPNTVRHIDGSRLLGHGTHVAGIAAGDGSIAGNGQPAFTYIGIAPEADIIVVRNDAFGGAIGMGDSANTLDAMQYIFDRATALNRPVVINLSQGDNIGPHDGTSLLERGIDNLLGYAGRIMVKSAGNEGDNNRHASGTVVAGVTQNVRFNMPYRNEWPDIIDIWYDGPDRFSITFTSPDGNTTAAVNPGSTTTLTLPNNNRIFVDSTLNNPNNSDNRIFVRIDRGDDDDFVIQAGNWSFNLTGLTVSNGRFDAWIDRNIRPVPTFISHMDRQITISIPGTAREIITVGSYVTNAAGIGSLSSFSSRGPTRDGRPAPTISAPGEWITSARADGIEHGQGQYHMVRGTSMSAPHVTGTVALMLDRNRLLVPQKVRDCLVNSARTDIFTGLVPNNNWGAGKLDAQAALEGASPFTMKLTDDPIKLKFGDDPIKPKFGDDPGTLKFRDDPIDIATNPIVDPVKRPSLEERPELDVSPPDPPWPVINPGIRTPGSVEPSAPFIVSTPHHSQAWSQSYPEAYAQTIAQMESAIQQYEQQLQQAQAAAQAGQLSDEQMQQVEAFYREYEHLVQEYVQLTQQGQ